MTKGIIKSFNVTSSNKHLLNIYDSNYYIELGTIDLEILNKLINGERILLKTLIHDNKKGNSHLIDKSNIINYGIGRISSPNIVNGVDESLDQKDYYYQFNYLYSIHQKSSSSKFVITFDTICYTNEDGLEKYAPVFLIPVAIDYQQKCLYLNGEIKVNPLIIKDAQKKELSKFEDLDYDEALKQNNDTVTKEEKQSTIEENQTLASFKEKITQAKALINKFYKPYYEDDIQTIADLDLKAFALASRINAQIGTDNYLTVINVEYSEFMVKDDYFSKQHSIYQFKNEEILKNYFSNVKGIKLTNIDQKYIILKAHNGESFCVDGKLGSGKTHTIINILADGIANNKKMLYVNESLDSIIDLKCQLSRLGLDKYVFNVSKNIPLIDQEEPLKVESHDPFDFSLIDNALQYENIYNTKSLGFLYRNIVDKITVEKYNGYTPSIEIKTRQDGSEYFDLQRNELIYIYNCLRKIEENFKGIDKYPENLYATLQSGSHGKSAEEIKLCVDSFYEEQKNIINVLNKFAEKYKIYPIKKLSELDELLSELGSLIDQGTNTILPRASWLDVSFTDEANKALGEIREISDAYSNACEFYDNNCVNDYKKGSCEKYYNQIVKGHYDIVRSNDKADDREFLNRILSSGNELEMLTNDIEKWYKNSVSNYEKIKPYFDFKDVSKDQFPFLKKYFDYYHRYTVQSNWVNEYLSSRIPGKGCNPELVYKCNKLEVALKNLELSSEKLKGFFDINLNFEEVDKFLISKFEQNIRKHVIKNKLKEKNKKFASLLSDVREYHANAIAIRSLMPSNTSNNIDNEETWKNYYTYLKFVTSLNTYETRCYTYFLNKFASNSNYSNEKLMEALSLFNNNMNLLDKFNKLFDKYHFMIGGANYLEIVESAKAQIPYIKRVYEAKNFINSIFKNKPYAETMDVIILLEVDNYYLKAIKRMEDNKSRYKALFFDAFNDFQTNITELYQKVALFNRLINRFIEKTRIKRLCFKKNDGEIEFKMLLSNLYEEHDEITRLRNKWYVALKNYSSCFFINKMDLQHEDFTSILSQLKEYVNKEDQIPYVRDIECILDTFNLYGCEDIVDKIHDGTYRENLAENFLYAMLLKNYNYLHETGLSKVDRFKLDGDINKLVEAEANYCENNLFDIRTKDVTKGHKNKYKETSDQNTNIYTKTLVNNLGKYNIFLAGMDALNNLTNIDGVDILIIDDAHLATSNKYSSMYNYKQTLIFGDHTFQLSIANMLMQRIKINSMIPLRKRYIELNNLFGNEWNETNNNYIYNPNVTFKNFEYTDICNISINIVANFSNELNKEKEAYSFIKKRVLINIVCFSEKVRRLMYSSLVKELRKYYSQEEVIKLLGNEIEILLVGENSRVADLTYFIYEDEPLQDDVSSALVKNNYLLCSKLVYICRKPFKNEEKELQYKKFIGRLNTPQQRITGALQILKDKLKENNVPATSGIGGLDFIIRNKKELFGVIILGKGDDVKYSHLDDYIYYKKIYAKAGWNILTYTIEDLYDDMDKVVLDIINQSKKEQ